LWHPLPTAFQDDEPDQAVIPPPVEDAGLSLSAEPTSTPFTVAPSILNRSEVVAAMNREYPPLLRDAGIGGTVRVYFFIDENGQVQDRRVDKSSGHAAIDTAAMAVAEVYDFTPALNEDTNVPVRVSFPITFQVR
jgi:protein TonB